jgi:hypothetical protein
VKDFEPDDYDGDLLDDYGDDVDPDYEDSDLTDESSQATKEVVRSQLRGCEAIVLDE